MTSCSLSTVKMYYNITSLKRALRKLTFFKFSPNHLALSQDSSLQSKKY